MARMESPVRIGVVGLGRFGRLHALTLSGLTEAELVAVVARRSESLERIRTELPQVRGWTCLEQAIQESDADAWVVACSTSQHATVTRMLLTAGKPVLLEKPLADNLDEAMSLGPLVLPDSRNLMLGHILLFNSEFQQLRAEAAQRGKLAFIDCVRHRPASILDDFPGENPLYSTMVHDLYCVQALMDRAEPVQFKASYHRTGDGRVDVANAQLLWHSGALASCTASFLTPSGMAPRGFDRMELFGQGWSARIMPNPRPIEVWSETASWPLPLEIRTSPSGPTGMMAEELRTFCRVVRGLIPVPVRATYSDALQVQRWMNTLHQAAMAAQ
jgi:predicted dehydrogenase